VSAELPGPGLDGFQAEIAEVARRVTGHQGFALAGAGALVVHGLISRPTQDLDLFSPVEGGPGQASASLLAALGHAGCQVRVLEPAEQHGGKFLRLQVQHGEHVVDIDLARDWRQHPPVYMQVGPVLHIADAVASKVTAMIGRGLPRHYIDVAAALGRYDRGALLRLAFHRDPGLRVLDVAHCMQLLDRLPDAPFADYGLTDEDVRQVRHEFRDWPRDHAQDHEGQRAHADVHHQHERSAASLGRPRLPDLSTRRAAAGNSPARARAAAHRNPPATDRRASTGADPDHACHAAWQRLQNG
jgi:hypothetical protein